MNGYIDKHYVETHLSKRRGLLNIERESWGRLCRRFYDTNFLDSVLCGGLHGEAGPEPGRFDRRAGRTLPCDKLKNSLRQRNDRYESLQAG